MTEEILSRLERIDHKEYSCGFEFADSSTFDEMARCFEERKILAKEIERLNNIITELDKWLEENKYFYDGLQNEDRNEDKSILLVIDKLRELKGSDKE